MNRNQLITESQILQEFRYLDLCDSTNWVDLVIKSGEHNQLVVTGPAKMVSRIRIKVENETLIISLAGSLVDKIRDALTTSLSRKKIRYQLTVKKLEGIELCGLIRLDTSGLESGKPIIRQLDPWMIPMRIPIPKPENPKII